MYYVTVVAVNRALQSSEPVCSDGVSVELTTVTVKEMTIENSKIKGGLIKDPGNTDIWILGNDRYRRRVNDTTPECL